MPSNLRRWLVQAYRAGVLVAIVALIHLAASGKKALPIVEIAAEDFAPFYASGALLGEAGPVPESRSVVDKDGQTLGYVLRTSPQGDRFVGYSGPTDSLLAFGNDGKLVGWKILQSRDTPEHLELVVKDEEFASQFVGKTWDELSDPSGFHGVSRATLTTLAIREGIVLRLSGQAPNLRFPDGISFEEVKEVYPKAENLTEPEGKAGLIDVLDAEGNVIGAVLRTAYLGDRAKGFQGPTDVLIALSADRNSIITIRVRSSMDNEPYVGDLNFDDIFMGRFDDTSVADAAAIGDDLVEEGIEGVSGATATSLGVVAAVREAARDLVAPSSDQDSESEDKTSFASFGGKDIGMLVMISLALLMSFTRLRGIRSVRLLFQVALVVYLGFLHGELISKALLVGWSQSGISWHTSIGLVILVAAAFVVPWATGHQVYCHQLCPHGAAQQLLGKLTKRKFKMSAKLGKVLAMIPGVLVAMIVVIAVMALSFNFSALEPFDAYSLWFAGGVTVIIAIVGLVASIFFPMAYCRYGCPTGAVLKFVRKSGGRFVSRDWFALILVGAAAGLVFFV